ncbi:MAG: LysM peptidoglycan-binding domain-containing protein [Lachnospiraceae bacterium]|nr:LysM peptidoglycan-binding domain-containing protein [Lachnospiraceae bacterium]
MKKIIVLAGFTFAIILFSCCIIASKANTNKSDAAVSTDRVKTYISYQICPGDTLTDIATSHMTEEYASVDDYIEEVKSINGFVTDTIYTGAYLVLPYYAE